MSVLHSHEPRRLYDVEIRDADDDDALLNVVHGILAHSPAAACDDPQVWQYVEELREEYPNAMPDRATLSA